MRAFARIKVALRVLPKHGTHRIPAAVAATEGVWTKQVEKLEKFESHAWESMGKRQKELAVLKRQTAKRDVKTKASRALLSSAKDESPESTREALRETMRALTGRIEPAMRPPGPCGIRAC